MNVLEARRTRHLVIRLDKGEELPEHLVRALDGAEARSAWITGAGALEAAEVVLYDQAERAYGKVRRIDGPCDAVAITGNVARLDGATSLNLSVTLVHRTEAGLETLGGQLVWARAFAVDLAVTVFDDLSLRRVADDRTGLPALVNSAGATAASPATTGAQAAPRGPAEGARAQAAANAAPIAGAPMEAPALPQRPVKPQKEVEQYPELGDNVTHFAFGDCTVIESDGDRIRLRQNKDGRVREVALTMLKIEEPTVSADGVKHFKLGRKN
jgi:predicted DNA-binding protein with PD1-like motif